MSSPVTVITNVQQLDAFINWIHEEKITAIDPNSIQMTPELRNLQNLLYEGHRYLQSGAFDSAISKYRQALAIAPAFGNARFFLAQTLKRVGKQREAIQEFQKAIDYGSTDYNIYIEMGLTFSDLGEKESEIQAYLKAYKMKPDCWSTLHNLAEVYREVKNYTESISWHEKSIRLSGGNDDQKSTSFTDRLNLANSYQGLGLTYYEQGRLDLAEAIWNKTLDLIWEGMVGFPDLNLVPVRSRVWYCLGRMYKDQKKWPQAADYLGKYVEKMPQDQWAQMLLREVRSYL